MQKKTKAKLNWEPKVKLSELIKIMMEADMEDVKKKGKSEKKSKIYIAGHSGMVGSAVIQLFKKEGYRNLLYRTSKELDLTERSDVKSFFKLEKPEYVILAAAKVGGIKANITYPVEFLKENLLIQTNVIEQSHKHGVKKILILGSSCIYPQNCPQPMKEEYLMTGKLEPTNEGYALAKVAGLKLLEYYYAEYGMKGINLMPCNLYGPNDSFDLNNSHVLSALIKRFVDAKDKEQENVTLWGTGIARREFIHVNDLANAILYFLNNYDTPDIINIGCGKDITIKDLAETIALKVGYRGKISWDHSKPDGMLRKCLDVAKMRNLGFIPLIGLEDGIEEIIEIYQKIKTLSRC